METETIVSFTGDYRWLSNFSPAEVVYQRETYASVEHAYQAAKTKDRFERQMIQAAESAGHAKRLAEKLTVRPDWQQQKLAVMEDLLRQKFAHGDLRDKLLATGAAELVEGNHWGDRFWGVCDGEGENHLGRLLMKIRSELREA